MFVFHVEHRGCGRRGRRYIRPVPHILAIANQKGGVGKTTTAVNLAASLAVADQRTLLIDGDPQGNATSGIGLQREDLGVTVYDLLIGGASAEEARHREVQFKHLDVLPATPDLAGAEVELINRPRRDQAMRDALAPIAAQYDYVLIDCPPSLGLITVNMLAAADALLIPVQCEYYALEGLSQLLNTVHLIQQSVNERLSIDGVLLTMFDGRLNLSRQVAADTREYFGPKVYESVIPRNVRLAEAPSFGKPIILYDVTSVGAQAYMAAAREMLRRHRGTTVGATHGAAAAAGKEGRAIGTDGAPHRATRDADQGPADGPSPATPSAAMPPAMAQGGSPTGAPKGGPTFNAG
jgi:chromosome partitioning protein